MFERRLLAGCVLLMTAAVAGCTAKYVRPTTSEVVEPTPERLARGEYLVKTVAACGACHDGRQSGDLKDPADPALTLAGGNYLRSESGIAVWIPNITGDEETGIGSWTDDEIIRSIRDGVKRDGSFLFPAMPYGAYQHISDEDVRAIVAYLRSVPPVKLSRTRGENVLPFPMRMALGMGVAMHEPVTSVPEPDRTNPVRYGEYLARVAHCTECHSLGRLGVRAQGDEWMAGADMAMREPGVGSVWAANLTPDKETGLGRYSAEQIKMSLRSGMRLDGKPMAPPMSYLMPYLPLAEEKDLDAIVAYLQALPPVKKKVPARELTPEYKQLLRE